jgi:hypothetical protein
MIKDRESCSRPLSGWERSCPLKLGKANVRAAAFGELGSASLREIGSGQSAGFGEASIAGADSIRRPQRTPRGERRQRARKEPSGTWEALRRAGRRQPRIGSHNSPWGDEAASDGLIVAVISRLSREGAKEPWPGSSGVRRTGSWLEWPTFLRQKTRRKSFPFGKRICRRASRNSDRSWARKPNNRSDFASTVSTPWWVGRTRCKPPGRRCGATKAHRVWME